MLHSSMIPASLSFLSSCIIRSVAMSRVKVGFWKYIFYFIYSTFCFFKLRKRGKIERRERSRQRKDRVGENIKGKERHDINEADIDGSESNILEEDMMLRERSKKHNIRHKYSSNDASFDDDEKDRPRSHRPIKDMVNVPILYIIGPLIPVKMIDVFYHFDHSVAS